MSYFTSQEVGNPVQVIKCVELSRFQPFLKLSVTFVESLFTLKPFKAVLGDLYMWQNELDIHNNKLLIMLENQLCCLVCAESDKWNFVEGRHFICITVLVIAIGNHIFIQNRRIDFDK